MKKTVKEEKVKKEKVAKVIVDREKIYTLEEGIKLVKETSTVKFDASVEAHINTGLDPKHADQILRFTTLLPNGTGKKVKIVAFVPDEMVAEAKKAGAIEAGLEDLVAKISAGFMDFDLAVAHPSVMKNLGKIAKQLGQARKMPTPKNGTVAQNVVEAIGNLMGGQIEVRTDKFGSTHNIVGKISFGNEKLEANILDLLHGVKKNKPEGSKGQYLKSIYLTTSMGPSIQLDIAELK